MRTCNIIAELTMDRRLLARSIALSAALRLERADAVLLAMLGPCRKSHMKRAQCMHARVYYCLLAAERTNHRRDVVATLERMASIQDAKFSESSSAFPGSAAIASLHHLLQRHEPCSVVQMLPASLLLSPGDGSQHFLAKTKQACQRGPVSD